MIAIQLVFTKFAHPCSTLHKERGRGAALGAYVGGAIGVWFGGIGIIPGSVIRSVIGSMVGGYGGSEAGKIIYDRLK